MCFPPTTYILPSRAHAACHKRPKLAIATTVHFFEVDYIHYVQGVHKVLHTFKILISQKPHMVETLDFRQ